MLAVGDRAERETISELVGRAVADGKTYAAARVEVVKQTALTGIDKAKGGIVLLIGGAFLAYAAVIVLLVAIFTWLADEIGPIASGAVVAGATLAIAYVMIRIGIAKVSGATAAVKGKIG